MFKLQNENEELRKQKKELKKEIDVLKKRGPAPDPA